MKRVKVSNNVIRRLPRYLRKLDDLMASGVSRISSKELGLQLGLTPSQIRQDFSCFGEFGQQGYGYNVPALREQIASILGMDRGFRAILIGVGNIGHALMDNFCFSDWGFHLSAAFDIKPELIGTSFQSVPILSMEELSDYISSGRTQGGGHPGDGASDQERHRSHLELHQRGADRAQQQYHRGEHPFFRQPSLPELLCCRAER